MRHKFLAALAVVPLLAACSSAGGGSRPATTKPSKAAVRPAVRSVLPPAQVHNFPGLEGVIGATAGELTRQFGDPRLDVWEGDARKLQFSGTPCTLDVYLYPPAQGREPQATYVDTRRSSDGRDVDRASCVASLRQR